MRPVSHLPALLLILATSYANAGDAAPGRLEDVGGLRILRLTGSDYEMGKQQGKLLSEPVQKTVRWLLDEAAKSAKLDRAALQAAVEARRAKTSKQFAEELRGLAEGSGVPLADLELAHAVPLTTPGTQGAAWGQRTIGGKLFHHFAFSSDVSAPPVLLIVRKPTKGEANVVATWPGCLGALAGMNAKGISVSALDGGTAGGEAGLPYPLVVRAALDQANSLITASGLVRDLPRVGSAAFIVGDGKIPEGRALEATADSVAVFGANDSAENHAPFSPLADFVRRSNLFVDVGLAKSQRPSFDPRMLSGRIGADGWQAYAAMTQLVNQSTQTLTIADVVHWRRAQPSHSVELVDVVFSPSNLEFWTAVGEPAKGPAGGAQHREFHRFRLLNLLAGEPADAALVKDTKEKPLDPASERLVKGVVQPKPREAEASMPERFRLGTESFTYEMEPEKVVSGVVRTKLRFPTPAPCPYPENNTVHAEYFKPIGAGPFPCVISLHIAGGDFELSRFVCNALAQQKIATVFVKMPYYGERRPPGKNIEMLSPDVDIASGAMRQVVLDLRRLCDWIEAYPDLDGSKIGVLGISLGSITGSLSSAIEPRISHACFIMGGARLDAVIFGSVEKEAREYRRLWVQNGGTQESLRKILAPFDAATYGDRLKERVVLMISANQDESIPKESSFALWEATGKQQIIWYPCGHYTMIKYLMPALNHAVKFFHQWSGPRYESSGPAPQS